MHPDPRSMTRGERAALYDLEYRIGASDRPHDIAGCLRIVRDRRLYRDTHATFADYARGVWHLQLVADALLVECGVPERASS
jgi:hypothetical protein